jgi:hypothetical protein
MCGWRSGGLAAEDKANAQNLMLQGVPDETLF